MKAKSLVLLAALAALPAGANHAFAQQATSLSLELNGAQPSDKGCRLTFVIALFNEAGVVDRMTVLDFKELSAGKTKVTRFDLSGTTCSKISRVLVNSATECVGQGVEPAACMRDLKTSSKAGITFGV